MTYHIIGIVRLQATRNTQGTKVGTLYYIIIHCTSSHYYFQA